MAIDPSIPLQVQQPNFGNAMLSGFESGARIAQAMQARDIQKQEAERQKLMQPLQDRMLTAQVASAEQQQKTGLQQQFNDEQKSLIYGAAQLKPLLDAGDVDGVRTALNQRRASLQNVGLNTDDTDQALAMLDSSPAQLKSYVDSLYSAGVNTGVIGQPEGRTSTVFNDLVSLGYQPGTAEFKAKYAEMTGPSQPAAYFSPVQTSTGMYSFNSRTGELSPMTSPGGEGLLPVTIDPEAQANVTAAKERAKVTAKAGAQAELDLPQAIASSEYSVGLLDQLLAHPGLDAATGASSRMDPRNFVPGSDAYNFNVLLDQVQGRTFLQAFESLKGSGQITEMEGTKAQNAIARMNKAQSKDEFVKAVEEFKGVINGGLERARQKASLNQPKPPAQQPLPVQIPPLNKQGWSLHVDAQGNKAYVGPNGEIEEVQ